MLDDFTVVGYGEWESRQALESHLQKGANLQHCAAVTSCMLLLRLAQSLHGWPLSRRICSSRLLCGDQSLAHWPHWMLMMYYCYADYFQEFKQGVLEHDIVAIKSPLK
jgi:hypothetical protein